MDTISFIYYSVVLMPIGLKILISELQIQFWFAFFSTKSDAILSQGYGK
jgi:hypothetical protein